MRRTIVVTDGDCTALEAVEVAANNIGARCISISGCHEPGDAHWTPEEVEELILSTPRDPVVVLVDDEGEHGEGRGERVLRHLVGSSKVAVLGVVAVASKMKNGEGAQVTASIDNQGQIVFNPVDKVGRSNGDMGEPVKGDTVENLNDLEVPIVVGLGDPGKMKLADDPSQGAPITTKALKLILTHAEQNGAKERS